jgi:hypothetical protein
MADLTQKGFPRRLSLQHTTGPLGPFEVEVVGLNAGAELVTRRARFSFVEGETRVLLMHLVGFCSSQTCSGGQTCTESGCRPIDVPESELRPWTGTTPRLGDTPDAGTPDTSTPSDSCVPSGESCNGMDDDCDGMVDEDFDLSADPNNCGTCGNRCQTGGRTMCCMGMCARSCP